MQTKVQVFRNRKEFDPDWKRKLADILKTCGLVDKDFTGTIDISFNSGGLASATKKKVIK